MPDEPPWEWAEGDRRKAGLFRWATGALLVMAGVGVIALTLSALSMAGFVSVPTIPAWVEPLWLAPMLVGVFFLSLYPMRNPVVGRLGISPIGIQLVFPTRRLTVKWSGVRWVGPDFVDVNTGFLGEHVLLTPYQVQRITRFLQTR